MRVVLDHQFANTVPIATNRHSDDENAPDHLAVIVHLLALDLAPMIDITKGIFVKSIECLIEINHLSK